MALPSKHFVIDLTVHQDVERNPEPLNDHRGDSTSTSNLNSPKVNLNSPATNKGLQTYSKEELLNLKTANFSLPSNVYNILKTEGLLKTCQLRSGIAVTSRNKKIKQQITYTSEQKHCRLAHKGVNKNNLINIPLVPPQRTSKHNSNHLQLCLLNARSLKNKTTQLLDYITDCKSDIAAINWFSENDSALRIASIPTGYYLLDQPRTTRKGGGVALLVKNNIVSNVCQSKVEYRSFEYYEVNLKTTSLLGLKRPEL